ncbi:MAG TPA: hypothetical protein VGO47_11635 [Chlamydiales bacterium]|nr:hypothetical protein [Chlamydiales bacterium]
MYPSDAVYNANEPTDKLLRGFLVVRVRLLFSLFFLFKLVLVSGLATSSN